MNFLKNLQWQIKNDYETDFRNNVQLSPTYLKIIFYLYKNKPTNLQKK